MKNSLLVLPLLPALANAGQITLFSVTNRKQTTRDLRL
jgi:hypothetical protein